jgi:hypothetical protein
MLGRMRRAHLSMAITCLLGSACGVAKSDLERAAVDASTPVAAVVSYAGCSYIGGIDRAVITRQDSAAAICVGVLLEGPSRARDAGAGLTVSTNWEVAAIDLWPMGGEGCGARAGLSGVTHPTSAWGSITVDWEAGTISAAATLVFPVAGGGTTTVVLEAQGVSLQASCTR